MEIALFLLTIFLSILLLFTLRNYYTRKLNRRPPGPRGIPLIGNMHQFDSVNTHVYLYKLSQKYGPLMSLQLGSVQTLVISSASAAKEVFKYHDLCFSSWPTLVRSWKLSYNGIDVVFAPYSEYWRDMRKICTLHLFSSKRSQSFQPIREQEVARMVKTMCDGAAADSNIVNLSKTLMTLTSSIIFRISFGKGYDHEEGGAENDNNMSSRFHWLLTERQIIKLLNFCKPNLIQLMKKKECSIEPCKDNMMKMKTRSGVQGQKERRMIYLLRLEEQFSTCNFLSSQIQIAVNVA